MNNPTHTLAHPHLPHTTSRNRTKTKNFCIPQCSPHHRLRQPKYDSVLSLKQQIGHQAKVTLPHLQRDLQTKVPRNSKRDAEQTAALIALHVLNCGLSPENLV